MTRVAIYFSVLLLLVAASIGASNVTNIELNKTGGFTTARIDIDGKIRFTHQTEDAKDGRPFRVIVDILSATHELGAKEFMALPNCLVAGIRTSQFSVKPEKVVRIVFDMKASPIYRVESGSNSVSIFFTDQTGQDFSLWSTADFVKKSKQNVAARKQPKLTSPAIALSSNKGPKSAASQNKVIATDRLASLEGAAKPAAKTVAKPKISKSSVQRAATVKVPLKPEVDTRAAGPKEPTVVKNTKTAHTKPKVSKQVHSKWTPEPKASMTAKKKSDPNLKPKTKPAAKVAAKSFVKVGTGPLQGPPPPAVSKSAKSKVASKKVASKDAKAKASVATAKLTPKKQTGKKAIAKQESKKPLAKKVALKKSQLAKTKKVAKSPQKKKTKVALVTKDTKPATKESSTSRFRRKPVVSNKIRGTLVAEFPKRLTIKYRSRSSYDPFETLINENRRYNDPIDKQVPNAEGLRLVGVIEAENGKNSALFEDKDGYGYILQSGDKVRKGYVLRVEADRVYFQIFEYGWSRTMALKMDQY